MILIQLTFVHCLENMLCAYPYSTMTAVHAKQVMSKIVGNICLLFLIQNPPPPHPPKKEE